jgi:DEAD/DEAH box helicase domain-containing protein
VDASNLGVRALFVYDRYPGGLGYAAKGYEFFGELLGFCQELVEECDCAEGCPSCVGLPNVRPPLHHDPDLSGGYAIPNKEATRLLLRLWLSAAE